MSDLVERLRHCAGEVAAPITGLLIEAADRIEHLESVAGKVSTGEDWLAIRKDTGRNPPKERSGNA